MHYDQKVLLTPGPLTTSKSVKESMLRDLGTRDNEYQSLVQNLRSELSELGMVNEQYSVILLQGSGTYGVESVLTSVIPKTGKVLILENGAYGKRMREICEKANIPFVLSSFSMIQALPVHELEDLVSDPSITHVAFIHCETTAGVMNDINAISALIKKHHKIAIVDAMSSFGSMPIPIQDLEIDFLITSSNKCLHGVPGIAIVYAKKTVLDACKGICHSLSLDLYDQYRFMETSKGGFRFTSPTHVILALNEAIQELKKNGGILQRSKRYQYLQQKIQTFMQEAGFETLVDKTVQSPIITTYLIPNGFDFNKFYDDMKEHGFLLYSGKLPNYDAFRIGNIGEITDQDIETLLHYIQLYLKGEKRC